MNDKDEKIELALDHFELADEAEPAVQTEVELASVRVMNDTPEVVTTTDPQSATDGESEYAVKPELAEPKFVALQNRASPPKGSTAAISRRAKLHPWLRNSNAMLAAAIVVGGIAAILVGNLVLWLLRPAPNPTPNSRYGAIDLEHRPSTIPSLRLSDSAVRQSA